MKQKCERVREVLNRFLDGDLPAAAATEVASHLGACVVCRHEYDGLKAVKDGLRAPVALSAERMEAARKALFARLEQQVARESSAGKVRGNAGTFARDWFARHRLGWQPALATVAAGGALALLLMTPGGPRAGGDIALPDPNEMNELYRLHDAHGGSFPATDPALHKIEADDTATLAGAR